MTTPKSKVTTPAIYRGGICAVGSPGRTAAIGRFQRLTGKSDNLFLTVFQGLLPASDNPMTAENPTSLLIGLKEAAHQARVAPLLLEEMVRDGWLPKPVAHDADETPLWPRAQFAEALKRINSIAGASPRNEGRVYVVGILDYVKIGFSRRVPWRLRAIQDHLPLQLDVYAIFDGDPSDERELHRRFQTHCTRGEWYRLEGNLSEWMREGCPPPRTVRRVGT